MNRKRKEYQHKYYLQHKEELNKNTPEKKIRQSRYYEAHKEQILSRTKKHYSENREKHNLLTQKYYQKHKKEHSENAKEYNTRNKDNISKQKKEYHKKNKDRIHQYYMNNKDKISKRYKEYAQSEKGKNARNKSHFKRRNKFAGIIECFTMQEWNEKLDKTNGICSGFEREPHFVGKNKLTIDHTPAISKAPIGFVYNINDVQPLCKSCNSKKKNKL